MTLAIKPIHDLPPHLSYVSTLPDITQNRNAIDELKERLIDTWDRIPQGIIDEASDKHDCMQRDVTLNTCCDLVTQLAQSHFRHTETGSFQSHSHYSDKKTT